MSNDLPNVREQNLRDFTVQICDAATNAIVGTGIVVSMDGRIATCAHVVRAAGVEPRAGDGAEVDVYFQHARSGEKARRAIVAAHFDQHDDDIVLLQLVGGPPLLDPEQIAVLDTAASSAGHDFKSYGYRRLHKYQGLPAIGQIVDFADKPAGAVLHARPVMISSQHIDSGMSGAAVLDVQRNLVVGVIAETWDSGEGFADRDTSFAIDAKVLTFDPLKVPMHKANYPLRPAPQPKTDIKAARAAVAADVGVELHDAPPLLEEWVGREELLAAISADWANPKRLVTGLIGFGGEGKSSLARRWVDTLLADKSQHRADGVFWWDFYKRRSVDEFFEAALTYLSRGGIDPRQYPSANARMHFIAGMLTGGRYIFVLDGLEVMQDQEGDRYGLLRNADLHEFLGQFAAPRHESFCLITSQAPVLDMLEYTTYTHREVDRLSTEEGKDLLRNVGVDGNDDTLEEVVQTWDGHALTLSLLGSYLKDKHEGDVAFIDEIPAPTAGEPRYDRVRRVLRRYDQHFTDADQAFLMIFCAFRLPIRDDAFAHVFRADSGPDAINAPLIRLADQAFYNIVGRLLDRRLIRPTSSAHGATYSAHPLIRAHYLERLTGGNPDQVRVAHECIKNFYLAMARKTPLTPTLDELAPLIEAVHHACKAGDYGEAFDIFSKRISKGGRFLLAENLGAWETELALMLEFFPGDDATQEPQVSDTSVKGMILNEVGLCLKSLGRLADASVFYERAIAVALKGGLRGEARVAYSNLAKLQAHLGALGDSLDAARQGLLLARRVKDKRGECSSLCDEGWTLHLLGQLEPARAAFQEAEGLQRQIEPQTLYLYSGRGLYHADHLRQSGDAALARHVAETNLERCKDAGRPAEVSSTHRILGDLDAAVGEDDTAYAHYDEAISIGRDFSRDVLIDALLARGRWEAKRGEVSAALSDLNEALDYAIASGYRLYQADLRVGLAWLYHAAGDASAARAEAERASGMSAQMGYHWGQVDAAEVLAVVGSS